MKFWLDGQISPKIAPWLKSQFGFECIHIRDLGLMKKEDLDIYRDARIANAIVITKDQDFLELSRRLGPPPQIVWVTCGNTSNQNLRMILDRVFSDAVEFLKTGQAIVEISD